MNRLFGNIMFAVALVATVSTANAQEDPKKGNSRNGHISHKVKMLNATEEQKAMLKENMELLRKNRRTLQSTYTAQQKEILSNKELKPLEKRKALEASYTQKQREMIEENKRAALAGREKIKSTLSEDQKAAFKNKRNELTNFQKDSLKKQSRKIDATRKTALQERRAPIQGRAFDIPNATAEQKAMLEASREKRKQQQAELEATYTAKQKEILADKNLDFRAKREALQATYTEAQKQLIAKHREESRADREKLMNTLSEEQKASFRKR
ncbi:hypothetical protein EIM50_18060 [Pseudoxanthomonas sp. SGD-10]|nr:hypothetical protein EIM50_18060 [Pseudoxanthomonas sp. SGD-10]